MAVMDAECEEMCYFFAHLHDERFGRYPHTGSGISRETGRKSRRLVTRTRARPGTADVGTGRPGTRSYRAIRRDWPNGYGPVWARQSRKAR
jgi:hypothetical protein